nr:Fe-only nitrogenase accessory protein AnfO [uncultured Desulfobacter sp.]
MKIAAYVNGVNHISNFYEDGKVVLFDNCTGSWALDKEEKINLDYDMGVAAIRNKLRDMVKNLDGCKIFVAGATRGVPYAILEGMGFNIWKSSGDVTQYLDYIEKKEQEEKERKNKPPVEPLVIGDIRDSIFEIDLRVVLEAHASLTSKSVLIPFFRKTSFNKLTVYCDHLPPWFEHQLGGFKLAAEAEDFEDYVKVTIVPND